MKRALFLESVILFLLILITKLDTDPQRLQVRALVSVTTRRLEIAYLVCLLAFFAIDSSEKYAIMRLINHLTAFSAVESKEETIRQSFYVDGETCSQVGLEIIKHIEPDTALQGALRNA